MAKLCDFLSNITALNIIMPDYDDFRSNLCIFQFKKNCFKKMRKSLCEGGCKIGDFKAITLKFCKIVYKG